LLDKCLVVLVGDHGEGLGENKTKFGDRFFGHIHYLYDIYMKVPLIIFDPTLDKKAERIKEMTTILDVAPTILGRMGWKKRPFYQGRDLAKKISPDSIFEETYTPEAIYNRFGMLRYPWHMVYTPETQKYELYNLVSDPGERNDIFETHKNSDDIIKLQKMLRLKASNILKLLKEVKLDKRSQEMLESLGYIK
jgi:arylsulfatase A-like enzyme